MEDPEIKKLLDDSRVAGPVTRSIKLYLMELARYATAENASPELMKTLLDEFEEKLPDYKAPMALSEYSVPELEKFWKDVSMICHSSLPGELEVYRMARDRGIPAGFLWQIRNNLKDDPNAFARISKIERSIYSEE